MNTTQATPGKVLQNNGCYTNVGNVQYTTNRINGRALVAVDDTAVTAVIDSKDKKIGRMNATYAPQVTCPPSCRFYPVIQGDILDDDLRLDVQLQFASIEARKIDGLPADRKLRVHVVGDASSASAAGTIGDAMVRYEARSPNGSQAYTYTHAWNEPIPVPYMAWNGARVLASCETIDDIKAARALGYACEWTYAKHNSRKVHERDGIKVLPCPNNFNKVVTCDKCMKCADIDLLKRKNWVIGLSLHGAVLKAQAAIQAR
jgi:hypothetical protein